MRVMAYVDGFNLYYRALKHSPHKWLDPHALCLGFLEPGQRLDRLRYFTARVSSRAGDPDAPRRQHQYLSALSGVDDISTHFGSFLTHRKRRPLANDPETCVEILDTEEKGSDVNLAAHLLSDGYRNLYDIAFVLSQDTDLCEPLRMVRDDLGKEIGLVVLDGRQANRKLAACASFILHLSQARLAAAQFPTLAPNRKGGRVARPDGW